MKNLVKPENEAEANAIQSVLEEHGIHAEIQSFHDTAYNGLFQAQYGWGVIRVSDRDLLKARKIVEEWKNAAPDNLPWRNNPADE
jgi:type III secretory pathway lipoprotein EscJ